MTLFQFNREFEDDEHDYISKGATYIVAENMEKAIAVYNQSNTNNENIWSVKTFSVNVFVDKELINGS